MKALYFLLTIAMLVLGPVAKSIAQSTVTFVNPTFPSNRTDFRVTSQQTGNTATVSSGSITINSGQASFSVTVYRSSTSGDNGYVSIYSGVTSPLHLLTNDGASQLPNASNNTSGRQWTTSGNVSSNQLSGFFDTGRIPAGDQKLYAVYFNFLSNTATQEAFTESIALVAGSSPTAGPSNPITNNYQCIPYGNTPQPLSNPWGTITNPGSPQWPSPRGNPPNKFVWQSSTDGVNWRSVYETLDRDYQPPKPYESLCYRVEWQYKDDCGFAGTYCGWSTHNTSPIYYVFLQSRTPIPPRGNYSLSVCGSGTSNLPISAASPGSTLDTSYPANNTYNWWVPYDGWAVSDDGANPFSTYNTGGSFITSNYDVVLTIPNKATPGTYAISVSGNGKCGQKSTDATIYVTITNGVPPSAISRTDFYNVSDYYDCYYKYDIYTDIVAGVSSYLAVGSDGTSAVGIVQAQYNQVYFPIGMQAAYGNTVTISAINSCGTTNFTSPPLYYDYGNTGPQCRVAQPNTTQGSPLATTTPEPLNSEAAYPNPASTELTLSAKGQEAEATLYDTRGAVQRVIHMRAMQNSIVNVLDLPVGLYHLRIVAKNKVILEKQILIQH